MEAIEFFNEQKRMCKYYKGKCDNCDLFSIYQPYFESSSCNDFIFSIKTCDSLKVVEQWSKKHPRKTRKKDFQEKYPKAEYKLDGIGTPNICCKKLGYTDCCPTGKSCVECWNEPVE